MGPADWILAMAGLYGAMGLVVGGAFVVWGVTRVDAGAKGAPWAFRLLILPGAAALWPVVMAWWLRPRDGGHS